MHNTRSLRSSSLVAFASLFLLASATPTDTTTSRSECLQVRSQELASLASCGDKVALSSCFSKAASGDLIAELENCFIAAGCSSDESQVEALWTLQRCDSEPSDLRRRRKAAMPIQRDAGALPGFTVLAARQQTPATTAPPSPVTAVANVNNSPSPCFTETSVTITSCTTTEAGKRPTCGPAVVPSQVCAEGLICQIDGSGNPSCMFKQSKLPLEGIIIAIIFASAIVLSIVGICFFCCRERREQNRLIRAAEAAKIAQEAKLQATADAKRPGASRSAGSSDRQPLMSQPGGGPEDLPPLPSMSQQYGGGYQQPGQSAEYGGAPGQNPFADSHPLR